MKMQTAILALMAENEKFKFVSVRFPTSDRGYTYKTMLDLVEGDKVLVDTASGMQIVTVREVLDISDVDLEANYEYKWVVQKVDFTEFEQYKQMEDDLLKYLRKKQRAHAVKAVTAGLFEDATEEEKATVKALVRL